MNIRVEPERRTIVRAVVVGLISGTIRAIIIWLSELH
jgi:hypothetical protein